MIVSSPKGARRWSPLGARCATFAAPFRSQRKRRNEPGGPQVQTRSPVGRRRRYPGRTPARALALLCVGGAAIVLLACGIIGCTPVEDGYGYGGFRELDHSVAMRDEAGIQLGEEYSDYSKSGRGALPADPERHTAAAAVLLYIPNRLLDLLDVFRADVGAGPTTGGVVRLSRFVQAGMRSVAPFSLRAGLRGRKVPLFLESSSEFGISPAWVASKDRDVGDFEVGAGLDLFVIGAYAGVDLGEAFDFVLGLVGVDVADDDF